MEDDFFRGDTPNFPKNDICRSVKSALSSASREHFIVLGWTKFNKLLGIGSHILMAVCDHLIKE